MAKENQKTLLSGANFKKVWNYSSKSMALCEIAFQLKRIADKLEEKEVGN